MTRRLFVAVFVIFLLVPGLAGLGTAAPTKDAATSVPAATRNPAWAKPMTMPGLPNLHQVDTTLYRSAQPEAQAPDSVRRLGITTVISLRSSKKDEALFKGAGVTLVHIPVNTWSIGDSDITRALRAIRQAKGPVLLHCMHGADRTGLTMAMYRIIMQGWSREDAKREMLEGGYGFHSMWSNIVKYLDEVDIIALKSTVFE